MTRHDKDLERLDDLLVKIGIDLLKAQRLADRLSKNPEPFDRATLATLRSHQQQLDKAGGALSEVVERIVARK